jgi:hypothetical protein
MRHPHGLRAAAGASKAIEFIASAQAQVNLETTIVINKPTGTQQGDLMIAVISTDRSTVTWTQPSGWTEAVDQGASPSIMVSYRTAGASEGANYTFTSSNSVRSAGIIVTYRNAGFDVAGSISTAIASNVQTAPAITMAQSKSTLLAYFIKGGNSITYSSPTSGLISLATDSDGTAPSWALYSQNDVASGSTGSKSATGSSFALGPGCLLIGIKPS